MGPKKQKVRRTNTPAPTQSPSLSPESKAYEAEEQRLRSIEEQKRLRKKRKDLQKLKRLEHLIQLQTGELEKQPQADTHEVEDEDPGARGQSPRESPMQDERDVIAIEHARFLLQQHEQQQQHKKQASKTDKPSNNRPPAASTSRSTTQPSTALSSTAQPSTPQNQRSNPQASGSWFSLSNLPFYNLLTGSKSDKKRTPITAKETKAGEDNSKYVHV